jgi:outer membrane protein TolC
MVWVLFLSASSMAFSQTNGAAPAKRNSPRSGVPDSTIEDKLVARALAGPAYDRTVHTNNINDLQVKKTKTSYLNLLTVSTGYTFHNTVSNSTNQYLAPGLNVGVTIPIGIFVTKRIDVKIAKETRAMNRDQQEILVRQIKGDILSKYKSYQTLQQLLVIENRIIVDQQATFLQIEKKFKDGRINIEEYNSAAKSYNEELANKLKMQLSLDQSILEIEEVIGVPLESVLHPN